MPSAEVHGAKCSQAYESQAHFAILKGLLRDGDGVVKVTQRSVDDDLKVSVDRSKLTSHGQAALRRMLLRVHMYRCTADAQTCREYYEELSRVDGEYLGWRKAMLAVKPPPLVFVQANTFLDKETVRLQEYDATVEGLIQSWVDRDI
jgi:dipeptidyl-peptidase III